ncbi:MAG: hypothetical protein HQM08_00020 [Candidatus Riflebacteria bacterium]|nr:hypothetical protein [Candidatus Riflebacteria bacterium]
MNRQFFRPFEKTSKNRGQAIIVVLLICMVLGILLGAVFNFQRGQINLLSKSAKDYLAICAAEVGINCVLSEMKTNPAFVTHGNAYIPQKDWVEPAPHTHYYIKSVSGLELDNPSRGVYSGRITLERTRVVADFKTRVRRIPSKENHLTQTVDESDRYYLVESIGRIGDVYRKVSAVVERFFPSAFLLYDEQILDLGGQGPYRVRPGILRRGRIYGHEMIKLSRRGLFDTGTEFREIEKFSTPGSIKSTYDAYFQFRNGKEGRLKSSGSDDPKTFDTFPEESNGITLGQFVLDGFHGGKSEKLPPLNPLVYKNSVHPKPIILNDSSQFEGFEKSKWRNPVRPQEEVFDLNFGWKFSSSGEKVVFYSTVPLRVWGCPPYKAITIFCEKDVYIAGDFNANPKSPQNYTEGYIDYKDPITNGVDKNGAMIISMGRIWFDYSNPMLFLRNEFHTMLDYEMASRLQGYSTDTQPLLPDSANSGNPNSGNQNGSGSHRISAPVCYIASHAIDEFLLMKAVYPYHNSPNSDPRMPLTSVGFSAISALNAVPKDPNAVSLSLEFLASLYLNPAFAGIREYFTYSEDPTEYKYRFGIKSTTKREIELTKLAVSCYTLGAIPVTLRDHVINELLDEATNEVLKDEPNQALGAWNAVDRLFKLALSKKQGFRMPEMTVNAMLIDSAQINARWDDRDGVVKVENEIGNIFSPEARCFPYVGSNTRIILRHMGGKIHLRTTPTKEFLDGRLREDNSIVRRNVWDSTYVPGSGDFYPPHQPAGFNIATWFDAPSSAQEFDSFK